MITQVPSVSSSEAKHSIGSMISTLRTSFDPNENKDRPESFPQTDEKRKTGSWSNRRFANLYATSNKIFSCPNETKLATSKQAKHDLWRRTLKTMKNDFSASPEKWKRKNFVFDYVRLIFAWQFIFYNQSKFSTSR